MKQLAPPLLARERLASFVLAMVLFGLELVLLVLLLLLLYLASLADASLHWMLLPVLSTFALNSWALGRSVKNSHFLWLYGRWPEIPASAQASEEQAQVLGAARHAFFEDEVARVPGLLSRLEPAGRAEAVALALGRALALDGRLEEAAAAFGRSGRDPEALRRLQPSTFLGLRYGAGAYFKPGDAVWARRIRPLLGLGVVLLALGTAQVAIFYQHNSERVARLWKGFDGSDFTVEAHGRFTLHFHDPAFRDVVLPVAEDALQQHLAYFGLPQDSFGEGQIQLYLCDSREEYVRRAPQTPAWEAASAMPRDNAIYLARMDPSNQVYFEVVVAHELCHLVYHKMVPQGLNDAWLNEGLAEQMGYAFALERAGIPRQAWLMGHRFKGLREKALPFKLFFKTDPHDIVSSEQVEVFYQQGFSIVYMLQEHFGRESFLAFLKVYGAGQNMDLALKRAYPTIPDVEALSAVWGLFFPTAT